MATSRLRLQPLDDEPTRVATAMSDAMDAAKARSGRGRAPQPGLPPGVAQAGDLALDNGQLRRQPLNFNPNPVPQAPNITTSPGAAPGRSLIPITGAGEITRVPAAAPVAPPVQAPSYPLAVTDGQLRGGYTGPTSNPNFTTGSSAPSSPWSAFESEVRARGNPYAGKPSGAQAVPPISPVQGGAASQGSIADRLRTGAQSAWDDVRGRPNVGPQKPLAGLARAKDLAGQGMNVLGRVGGALTVGDSAVENAGSMGRLWANDNAGTLDKIAGTAEGLGNVAAETALSFTKKFPVIGPMVAGAVGPSPVSRVASMFPGGSTLQKYAGADPTTNAEQMLRSPVASRVPPAPAPAPTSTDNTLPTSKTPVEFSPTDGPMQPAGARNNVLRVGNSYSGPEGIAGNVQVNNQGGRGTVTMMGGQPGDATPAQRLAQIERDTAHAREMNGLRQQVADSQNPMAGVTGLIGSGGYGGARTPEQLARDAAVSASSITNTQGLSARQRRNFAQQDAQLAIEARRNDQNNETLRRGQDITGRGQDLQHFATLRGQDITGRGQDMTYNAAMYGHDVDLRGKMAPIEMKRAQMQRMQAAMSHSTVGGDPVKAAALLSSMGDVEGANALLTQARDSQTLGHNNVTNAKELFGGQFYRTDEKGARVEDTEAKGEAFRRAQQNSGGKFAELGPEAQAAELARARAETNILRSANEKRGTRVSDFFGTTPPAFSNMPTDKQLRSAKLDRMDFWDDVFTTGNRKQGDHRLTWVDDSGGEQTMYIDPNSLEQADVSRLLRNGAKQGK